MLKAPVFLLCSERSGSNLIRTIMNAHHGVYAPMPVHLVRQLWRDLYRYGDLTVDRNWHTLLDHVQRILEHQVGRLNVGVTREELLESVPNRSFRGVFEHIYEKGLVAAGKGRLFLKENHAHEHLHFLIHEFPDAQFVFQVRDPRDVVASMKRLPTFAGLMRHVDDWKQDQVASLRALHTLPNTKIMCQRYEDLLRSPAKALRRLCGFLGLPFDAEMLAFHTTVHASEAAALSVAWKNLQRPLLADNHGKYRRSLRTWEIKLVEHVLGDLMDCLGYDRASTCSSSAMRPAAAFFRSRLGPWIERLLQDRVLPMSDDEAERRRQISHVYRQLEIERKAL